MMEAASGSPGATGSPLAVERSEIPGGNPPAPAATMATIEPGRITAIVLAGGRGLRMGGVDKGLQNFRGMPLARHALLRIGQQAGHVMVNANRNQGVYESFGVPVWPDAATDFAGPLAGYLCGLAHCTTPYLVSVPCDTPAFPADLVQRLAAALVEADAEIAMAATRAADGSVQRQPVFCLMRTGVLDSLVQFMASGQRKVDRWAAGLRCAEAVFDDEAAFANANTVDQLQQLERGGA